MKFWLIFFLAASAHAKSVVLMIGDGMGPAWIRAARDVSKKPLVLDSLPNTALVQTFSSDNLVTDSAAAATAMATGVKTKNHFVGVNEAGRPQTSISKIAKDMKHRVGLVTTTSLTHATPAAFYAHTKNRNDEPGIAAQLAASQYDVLLGGGRIFFSNEVLKPLEQKYHYVRDNKALWTSPDDKPVLGLFADTHLPYELGRAKGESSPTLDSMVRFALPRLQAGSGDFFLMIEGGRIDHAAHRNHYKKAVAELLAFDRAVDFVIRNSDPEKVLVLVTADHETGGLTLPAGSSQRLSPNFSSEHHTAVDVILYAWGWSSEKIRGTLDNTALFEFMRTALAAKPRPR